MVTEWADADDWRFILAIINSGRDVDRAELAEHVLNHRGRMPRKVREYVANLVRTYGVSQKGRPRIQFTTEQFIAAAMTPPLFEEEVEVRRKAGKSGDARVDAARRLGKSESQLERLNAEFFPSRKK